MKNREQPQKSPAVSDCRLFSIGHSGHELPKLVDLLRQAEVTAIADVRSQPYSGRQPQFNREELEGGLSLAGIAYFFLGQFLGGRPQQPSLYDEKGRVDYLRVRATAAFQQGCDRLCELAQKHRVAMLCAEEDPLECHRALMIAPSLVERGFAPVHLRGDGSKETTPALEKRLLAETRIDDGSDGLFAAELTPEDRRETLSQAYETMRKRKAFRLRGEE